MQRQESDVGYLIIGLILGGLISSVLFANIPSLSAEVAVALSIVGSIVGLAIAYAFAHTLHNAEKRYEEERQRHIQAAMPQEPPTQIVGKRCTKCMSSIIFEEEGSFCLRCFQPYCQDCKPFRRACERCRDG